jgi:DNA polymerase III subunit epsilon
MFAIVDIETCGGKFEFRKGRITEICIVVHDGLQVVEKFTTLLNPECPITYFYTRLTGITNEMVANAPKFHEVAKKILELTEGRIFVAHNVSFDYNFIRDEFASLGYKFRREKLCTVNLSRKLLPGRISYSLGNLCASLGIENEARHRAEGDTMATVKLFELLLELKSHDPQYKNMGVEKIMTRKVDNIKDYILKKLPEECGVYYFLDKDQNIIYIGKSLNMYNRAQSHFNTRDKKGKKMLYELFNVDFVLTGSEIIALLLESEEIKKHKPKYNRRRISDTFTHCISWHKDEKGIINFAINPFDEAENSLRAFTSISSARELLERWIEDYELCINYCGLMDKESVCFNHQIKKCNGICAGMETVEEYNRRAKLILEEFTVWEKNFVLLDRGRHEEENSMVMIENGRYKGYGYLDSSVQINKPEELRGYILNSTYYPDHEILLKAWLKHKKLKKIVW